MRKILCNATAYQLMAKVREDGLDKAYDWFMELSKTENLNPREQMHIVLLAGGIRESALFAILFSVNRRIENG